MKQELDVLAQAVNKANLKGVFTLQESAIISQALGSLQQSVAISEAAKKSSEKAEKLSLEAKDKEVEPGAKEKVEG